MRMSVIGAGIVAAAILSGCSSQPGDAPTPPPATSSSHIPAGAPVLHPTDLAGLLGAGPSGDNAPPPIPSGTAPALPAMVANLAHPVPDHACDPGAWPPCDR